MPKVKITSKYKVKKCTDQSITLNLLQVYEAEFSNYTKKLPQPSGLYELDVDLTDYTTYLIYDEDSPIGFALKGMEGKIHDIADFYIVPSHRKLGAGQFFILELLKKYKGNWQARQIQGYSQGKDFAMSVLKKAKNVSNIKEDTVIDPYWGEVTIQYFKSI